MTNNHTAFAILAAFMTTVGVGCGAQAEGTESPDQEQGAEAALTGTEAEGAAPAYSCSIDSYSHVTGADWLRVHTSPGAGTPAVGQIPGGSGFHFCSRSSTKSGPDYWVYGYGYNGSTKLTGWVDSRYLAGP